MQNDEKRVCADLSDGSPVRPVPVQSVLFGDQPGMDPLRAVDAQSNCRRRLFISIHYKLNKTFGEEKVAYEPEPSDHSYLIMIEYQYQEK